MKYLISFISIFCLFSANIAEAKIGTKQLEDSAVTGPKIANGAVTEEKIGPAAIDGTRIKPAAVTKEKIAPAAVTTEKIKPAAVTDATIADGAVKETKIAPAAVTSEKIASGSIETSHLGFDTATQAELNDLEERVTDLEDTPSASETRYLQVPPHSFRPRTNPIAHIEDVLRVDYLAGQGIRFTSAPFPLPLATVTLLAPIMLPNGAEIISFECFAKDNDDTQFFTEFTLASLNRVSPADDIGNEAIAAVPMPTAGESGYLSFSTSIINVSAAVVETALFHYLVNLTVQMNTVSDDFFDPSFRGCRVGYIQ